MADKMPDTIRDVETRYWDVAVSKLAALAILIGGVITVFWG